MKLPDLATNKYRWLALVFLALGLAIVIIDNTVLNVAIPYILRDLKTSFDRIQWVVSGYALIIATVLITSGRLGDMIGRKKIFLTGTVLFALGSFIASVSQNVYWLFIGEALIEAVGASMMLTTSLSLLVNEFRGKERTIAFGVWGSVAGASAALGPLIGGYLTTYYSWRWSLRINVIVAVIAILGSVFIKESKGYETKRFDWAGTFLSGAGLFSLVFALIEGRTFGWWKPVTEFTLGSFKWPFINVSVIPFAFGGAILFLTLFILMEYVLEKRNRSPLLKLSMFKNKGFSVGLAVLMIMSLGQFGVFFVMPIYLQNVLGLTAFQTGLVFLWNSLCALTFGSMSGFVAVKLGSKPVVTAGMFMITLGTFLLILLATTTATGLSLAPGLIIFGIGIGLSSSQLTNIVLSSAPMPLAGEASAANSVVRQIGTSIGVAVIGAVMSASLSQNLSGSITKDKELPVVLRGGIINNLKNFSIESGIKNMDYSLGLAARTICYPAVIQKYIPPKPALPGAKITPAPVYKTPMKCVDSKILMNSINVDVDQALNNAVRAALIASVLFSLSGSLLSLFIPRYKAEEYGKTM